MVQIHPSDFNKPSARAIEDNINAKYADKVIHQVGLCVGFHSIISTSEGLIGHGTGLVNVNVDFRVIVFRPFKGEIVLATITHSGPRSGVHLSHDFFADVVVPPETLFEGSAWTRDDRGGEGFVVLNKNPESGEEEEWFHDKNEKCMYRVEEEQWHDLSPKAQSKLPNFLNHARENDDKLRESPYLIRGSMMLSGLGPTLWWYDPDATYVENGDGTAAGDAKMALGS